MSKRHHKLIRNLLALIIPLAFILGLNKCKPATPAPAPIPNAFQLTGTGNSYVEMTAAASPPSGSGPCKDGMLLVPSGSTGGAGQHLLAGSLTTPVPTSYDLAGWDGTKWAKRGAPPIDPPPTGANEAPGGSDNQAGRLANGDLLFTWNGTTKSPLPDGSKPSWWSDWGTPGNVVPDPIKDQFPTGQRDGYRAAQVIWRYSCSQGKWLNTGMMDGGVIQGRDQNGVAQAGHCVKGAPWVAGFDRPELYIDPWGFNSSLNNQRIYFSTRCSRPDGDDSTQVFMSPDTGETWNQGGIRLPAWTPVVMTSTNNGRLFMLQPIGTSPVLHWSDDKGASLASDPKGYDISYERATPLPPDTQKKYFMDQLKNVVTGVGESQAITISMARTGKNSVLAVYPSLEVNTVNGKPYLRQVAAVVWVFTTETKGEAPTVVPIKIIRAEAPNGSVLMPTFIQDDRPDAKTTTSLLYWIETKTQPTVDTKSDPVKMQARYLAFNGIVPETETLLSDAAGWETMNRTIYDATGDYMKGAFYFHNGTSNFVSVWPQTSPADPNKLANQVFARIISFKPKDGGGEPTAQTWASAKMAPVADIKTTVLPKKLCEYCVTLKEEGKP